MAVILPLFLVLLALSGGVGLTYVFMDPPPPQAPGRGARPHRQLLAAERFQEELDRRERKLSVRTAEAGRVEAGLARREQALAAREQEFGRKAVSYADLEGENRLLRSE